MMMAPPPPNTYCQTSSNLAYMSDSRFRPERAGPLREGQVTGDGPAPAGLRGRGQGGGDTRGLHPGVRDPNHGRSGSGRWH